jgi:crotonobetainyl-CoA:carnitine CoA-transferase CaiB-like acyl-CoA transferase
LDPLELRSFFEEVEHPVNGRAKLSTVPLRFSGGPDLFHRSPAPALGQHNQELLSEMGLTPVEIAELEADGVVGRSSAMRAST